MVQRMLLRSLICAVAMMTFTTACGDFLDVHDPSVIDASDIDSLSDPRLLAISARQNFSTAAVRVHLLGGLFVGEVWNGNPAFELEQFGLRSVVPENTQLNGQLWVPLSRGLRAADRAVELLGDKQSETARLELARASLYGGYSLEYMAESFCQGVINGGPPLTPVDAIDSAIARFTNTIEMGGEVAESSTSDSVKRDANDLIGAALVGRARAELQTGRLVEAAADADRVPEDFSFDMLYLDDPAARGRLGNRIFESTFELPVLVVAPAFRVSDPRVPWTAPEPGQLAGDGVLPFYGQAKYTSYDAPIRLASRIEADYIAAEARGTDAMLLLIASRRAANDQPAYSGPANPQSVLTELMEQRGREFYLEGKRTGDFRRHPEAVLHVPEPGTAYYKPGFDAVGSEVCLPVPSAETLANPHFP
jgi:hypothetical protein